MADHPLRSATHRCLGRPLPHQLANGTRTHLYAIACKQRPSFPHRLIWAYPVLAVVSNCYPRHRGRLSTCYSPVRHFTQDRSPFRVRLACVKHAASVQSEPESNSPVQICCKDLRWHGNQNLKVPSRSLFTCQWTICFRHPPQRFVSLTHFAAPCQQFFSRFREVFFIEAVKSFSSARFVKLLKARPLVNNFFPLFDFFFHSTRCCRREVRTYSFSLSLSTTFFGFRKNPFSIIAVFALVCNNSVKYEKCDIYII